MASARSAKSSRRAAPSVARMAASPVERLGERGLDGRPGPVVGGLVGDQDVAQPQHVVQADGVGGEAGRERGVAQQPAGRLGGVGVQAQAGRRLGGGDRDMNRGGAPPDGLLDRPLDLGLVRRQRAEPAHGRLGVAPVDRADLDGGLGVAVAGRAASESGHAGEHRGLGG